jgi:hypothetical protein
VKQVRNHDSGRQPDHHDVRHHRTGRAAPWFVVAAVALIAAIVASCGGDSSGGNVAMADGSAEVTVGDSTDIFDTDFLGACDGVGFQRATPFSQTPGVIHPVLVLAGEGTEMYGRSTAVRDAWTRSWTPEQPLALAEIELVVCAERVSAVKVEECTGYELDDAPTDNVVNLNEVVYEVSLREARTGAEVAATRITARDESCPMFVSFSEGETVAEHYSFDDGAIQAFVEPYVVP